MGLISNLSILIESRNAGLKRYKAFDVRFEIG